MVNTVDTTDYPSAVLARALVTALAACNVRDVVLCPGSRNAPLLYAFHALADAGRIRVHVRLDERSAGFMAVGLAKAGILAADPRMAVVVTTSGTAVANLHPAVLEADAAGIPLMVITANRPEALWHTGANQTTTQPGIFAGATRFSTHIPAAFPPDSHVRGLACRLVAAALGTFSRDPGPVHLDVSFDDPLVPNFDESSVAGTEITDIERTDLEQSCISQMQGSEVSAHTQILMCPARTVVVAGDGAGAAAETFARSGGWPLLAEPSSGARFGSNALTHYQQILTGTELIKDVEQVVVFGHPTLSRPVSALLSGRHGKVTVVATTPRWTDVAGIANVVSAPVQVRIIKDTEQRSQQETWLERWLEADRDVTYQQGIRSVAESKTHNMSGVALSTTEAMGSAEAIRSGSGVSEASADFVKASDKSAGTPDQPSETLSKPIQEAINPSGISNGFAGTPPEAKGSVLTKPARTKDEVCAKLWEASCPGEYKRHVPALMIGASDVIRSFDRFAVPDAQTPIVASNRGLAGIDGTISTALGLQAGLATPVRVVLGDLAALHDLTGLLHGSLEAEADLQIVVLNDHGGSIFSGLEHAQAPRDTLARMFLTPQDADFSALAHAMGWKYAPVDLRAKQGEHHNQSEQSHQTERANHDQQTQLEVDAQRIQRARVQNMQLVVDPDQSERAEQVQQLGHSTQADQLEQSTLSRAAQAGADSTHQASFAVSEEELPALSHDSVNVSNPQPTGLELLEDLLSHPIQGRSLIEVLLPAV